MLQLRDEAGQPFPRLAGRFRKQGRGVAGAFRRGPGHEFGRLTFFDGEGVECFRQNREAGLTQRPAYQRAPARSGRASHAQQGRGRRALRELFEVAAKKGLLLGSSDQHTRERIPRRERSGQIHLHGHPTSG